VPTSISTMSRGSCCTSTSSSSKSNGGSSSNCSSYAVRCRFKYALALLRRGHEVPISSSTMSRGSCKVVVIVVRVRVVVVIVVVTPYAGVSNTHSFSFGVDTRCPSVVV